MQELERGLDVRETTLQMSFSEMYMYMYMTMTMTMTLCRMLYRQLLL